MENIVPQHASQKQCCTCKQWFDATNEYFHHYKASSDGLNNRCRPCANAMTQKSRAKQRANPKPPREKVPDGFKRCSQCQTIKGATTEYFGYANTYKGGKYHLQSICRECMPVYVQRTSLARAEKQKAQESKTCTQCSTSYPPTEEYFFREGAALRSDCKECCEKRRREYYVSNQEYILNWKKNYDTTHHEQHARHAREHRQRYPEKDRAHKHKRRALKTGNGGTYTPDDIQQQLQRQKYRCYYASCNFSKFAKIKGKYTYHIDHIIPLSRGGTNDMSNIVLTCPECNMHKHDKLPHEWGSGGRLF